jgi:hypothetical protein
VVTVDILSRGQRIGTASECDSGPRTLLALPRKMHASVDLWFGGYGIVVSAAVIKAMN